MSISLGFWEWGRSKRRDAHITVTLALKKREGNWAELTFAKTSGTVTWELKQRRFSFLSSGFLQVFS